METKNNRNIGSTVQLCSVLWVERGYTLAMNRRVSFSPQLLQDLRFSSSLENWRPVVWRWGPSKRRYLQTTWRHIPHVSYTYVPIYIHTHTHVLSYSSIFWCEVIGFTLWRLSSYLQEDIIGFDYKDQSLTRFMVRVFFNCEKNTRHMNTAHGKKWTIYC